MTVQRLPKGWVALDHHIDGEFAHNKGYGRTFSDSMERIICKKSGLEFCLRGYMWTNDYFTETCDYYDPATSTFHGVHALPTHWWPTDRKTPAKYAIYSPAPQQGDRT